MALIFSKRANKSATGRVGEADGPGERLQSSAAARRRMLKEEKVEGLGERDEFKGNKGDERAGEEKEAF